jgi:hypothetical protein
MPPKGILSQDIALLQFKLDAYGPLWPPKLEIVAIPQESGT